MPTFEISDDLATRLEKEAKAFGYDANTRLAQILEGSLSPKPGDPPRKVTMHVDSLVAYLKKIPAIEDVWTSPSQAPQWWLKFNIDIESPIAWHVVQELGFVLNFISLSELLPTVFKPVSPPPYLNGGPDECLSWVIEAQVEFLDARFIVEALEDRLPSPPDDLSQWLSAPEDE